MVITDLDGTLLNSGRIVSPENRRALERLGELGVVRVIATGRSLFSFNKVIERDFPVDYLLFSSGGGHPALGRSILAGVPDPGRPPPWSGWPATFNIAAWTS